MKFFFNIGSVADFAAFLLLWGCDDSQILENNPIVESRSQTTGKIDYYWYEGQKVYLEKKPEKHYIVYKKEDAQKMLAFKSRNSLSRSTKESNELKLSGIVFSKNALAKKMDIMWDVIEGNLKSVSFDDNPEIIYNSSFYKSSSGEDIGISPLFYVKLKSDSDKDKLIYLANKYHVEVLGNNEFMPLWYTLSCDNESVGDALQMANQFYETGFFETAEPDIMTGLTLNAPNDTYFSSQWNLNGSLSINWLSAHQLTQGANIKVGIYGVELDVVAPGENIVTTEYRYQYNMNWGGTSAACPHVAGIAALILSANNNLTSSEVGDIIEQTARKVGGYTCSIVSGRPNGTWNKEMGYGLVDAYAAVMEAKRRL